MKKFNWIKTWLLPWVTLGIYSLCMWYTMAKNSNAMAEKYGVKKIMSFIPAILLSAITCGIVGIIWTVLFFKQQSELAAASGSNLTPTSNVALLWLIFCFVPIYRHYVLCTNYNTLVDTCEIA